MKFRMAERSLFAVLLRSRWWVSALIALTLGLVAAALLPDEYRVVGALSGFPFAVIAAMAAWRGRHKPSDARIEATRQAVAAMAWPAFSRLLTDAFVRDGHAVQPGAGGAADFVLERRGRRMVVAARRWKSAHTGLELLKALQAAREAAEAQDALLIALGPLTDTARPYAAQQRIAVWQAAEIAEALRNLPLGGGKAH